MPALDVSGLPTYGFGSRMTPFWGTIGFMVAEGMGFLLAAAAYLYLAARNPSWPVAADPPGLLWSGLLTGLLVASPVPNEIIKRKAKEEDLAACRRLLLVMSAMGLLAIGLRALEFTTLNTRWTDSAYGSVLRLLLGLHTTHIVTDVGDTLVLSALMWTRHGQGRRFSDVEDNAFYWIFVVVSWLPIFALIYLGPRV